MQGGPPLALATNSPAFWENSSGGEDPLAEKGPSTAKPSGEQPNSLLALVWLCTIQSRLVRWQVVSAHLIRQRMQRAKVHP